MEAGGDSQGGHQTPERERDRGEKSTGEQRERLVISLLEIMLNKYINIQEETVGKHGYITIFEYLFFMSHCQ